VDGVAENKVDADSVTANMKAQMLSRRVIGNISLENVKAHLHIHKLLPVIIEE
jgi:hypothetical protein